MPDLRKAECVERAMLALGPQNATTKIRECRKVLEVYERQVLLGDVSPCVCGEMARIFGGILGDSRKYAAGGPKSEELLEELERQEN